MHQICLPVYHNRIIKQEFYNNLKIFNKTDIKYIKMGL